SGSHLWQPFALLVLASELEDWIHTKSALDRSETPDPGIAGLEFLHNQPVRDIVHTCAAILFGQICAQHAELRQTRNQLNRKTSFLETARDDRRDFLFNILPDLGAHQSLFIRKQAVNS